jgi:outer membrane cobalamin receptor
MVSLKRIRALVAPCAVGVTLACSLPSVARAQSVAPAASPSPAAEIGRVSTSDRQDEPANQTARTTYVVTKAEMLLHGDDNVASALDRVPGVLIQHFGGPGSAAEITVNGQRTDGNLILLDGRPVSGGGIGVIDLASMPTAGVERIEVVEGAGATLYGNGASSSIVNIITTRSTAAYKTPIVSVAGGSYGYGRASIETANFSFAREIVANTYDTPSIGPGTTRVNADLSSTNARFTDVGTFGNLQISGSAGFISRIIGIPGQDTFLTSAARQQDDQQDARLSFALKHPNATTTLDLSGSRETVTFLDPSVPEGGPFLDFSTDARVQASLRNNVVSDRNRLIYGLDLVHGVARNDGSSSFGAAYAATPYAQSALYAQDSYALGGTSRIYAGVRGERDGARGGALSPSLGSVIGFGGNLSLRLNAGTAFRVPTAEDLEFPGYSNPLLQPERSQSFDATLNDGRVFGGPSIGWFVQTASNLISGNPNVDFSQPFGPGNEPLINQPQSSVAGFILSATAPTLNGITTRLSVTDTYRALGYADGMQAARLVDRPVFSTSLDIGYTGAPTNTLAAVGAVAHTVGALSAGAGNYTTVDGYVRLRVAQHALVSVRVYDLGNERYEEVAGYPMPGRTLTVELSTR